MKKISFSFNLIIDLTILLLIAFFLLTYFNPQHLLSQTTTTGGDTASHYNSLVYLKEVLLPQSKIMGWMQGNYAGFPLFYHYFPLSFLFMAFLSFVIPMQIAFKLGTVLGVFLLPVCVYAGFRFLKYKFPIPIIAALFSLVFLFNEGNSMWGGNILSTLAGEFSYSLGLALFFLLFGSLYRGIEEQKYYLFNALGVALLGMSHAVTLFFLGVSSLFFLFSRRPFKNLKYLATVYGWGFLLMSFWFVPFLGNLSWVTSFVFPWQISSFWSVLPPLLVPFFGLTLLALINNFQDRRSHYFLYALLLAVLIFFVGPQVGILDIRFMPFFQLFITVFGATIILKQLSALKAVKLLPFIVMIIVFLLIKGYSHNVAAWVKWNFEGFEQKKTWTTFKAINDYLKDNLPGRVLYEHTPVNNTFGSLRAFESLPYFAKRDTLEGLYMMASITSPFVFHLQSETSEKPCHPYPNYFYCSFNLQKAKAHLKLFNVSQFIARSKTVKQALAVDPDFKLEKKFGDYAIYRFLKNSGQYVIPLQDPPILVGVKDWRKKSYRWFANYKDGDQLLVFDDLDHQTTGLPDYLPAGRQGQTVKVSSYLSNESISIKTSDPRFPLLIKVSYHPNWRVRGAKKIYLVSPSFMLIFPQEKEILLTFEQGFLSYLGRAFSLLGLFLILLQFPWFAGLRKVLMPAWLEQTIKDYDNFWEQKTTKLGIRKIIIALMIIFLVTIALIFYHSRNYNSFYLMKRARQAYRHHNYVRAAKLFNRVVKLQNNLGAANEAGLFYALSLNAQGKYAAGLKSLDEFISEYPSSYWTPQACFERAWSYQVLGEKKKAMAAYQAVIKRFPQTVWRDYSLQRLKKLK